MFKRFAISLLAGLQTISPSYYEAAVLDGAALASQTAMALVKRELAAYCAAAIAYVWWVDR